MAKFAGSNNELREYHHMLLDCRQNSPANPGLIYSPTFHIQTDGESSSVNFMIWNEESFTMEAYNSNPVSFKCEASALAEQVLNKYIGCLGISGSERDFMLRVYGKSEYLCAVVPISDFVYVQECIKLGEDVKLVLVEKSTIKSRSWARTREDDSLSLEMDLGTILPGKPDQTVTYKEIVQFLDVIQRESNKIREKLFTAWENGGRCHSENNNGSNGGDQSCLETVKGTSSIINPSQLIQPVKGVCSLLGNFQTVAVRNSLDLYVQSCNMWNAKLKKEMEDKVKEGPSELNDRPHPNIQSGRNRRRIAGLFEDPIRDFVFSALDGIKESIDSVVGTYSKSFPVSFQMRISDPDLISDCPIIPGNGPRCQMTTKLSNSLLRFRIEAVHRLRPDWLPTYLDFSLVIEVFHGSTRLAKTTTTDVIPSDIDQTSFFTSLIFDRWVEIEHLPLRILPRESRLTFTLVGRVLEDEITAGLRNYGLGWASIQCFDFKGQLIQGSHILPFWSKNWNYKTLGPAPSSMTASDNENFLISIEFPQEGDIYFPDIIPFPAHSLNFREFSSGKTRQLLSKILEDCNLPNVPAKDMKILWENRLHLHNMSNSLPKVLLSATQWDCNSLGEIYSLLSHWRTMEPIDAMQLLLPCFPDCKVREKAVHWISKMSNDDLVNILPQLVEALSYETYDVSTLAKFLLSKSQSSFEVSHAMFWILASQVGLGVWGQEESVEAVADTNSTTSSSPVPLRRNSIFDPKRRRLELTLNSLMISCGGQWRSAMIAEFKMTKMLGTIATKVKYASSTSRNLLLMQELQKIDVFRSSYQNLKSLPLPLSPAYSIQGIEVESCHSFSSASVPIKINFENGLPEGGIIPILFKKGDDLRQDMLTIQIIRVIEKWWLKEGLDLRVLTFSCVPTGYREGILEIVQNCETLCKIQAEHGLTGPFRDKPIADWLVKTNPDPEDYKRAVENFTLTCAAYSVITYVLGISDRHNDNIMLTTGGHLFHIDFGKFLGDSQKIGSFKRDRTPFVLTSDMVFVINDGGRSPQNFHHFVELCCEAFRIVRRNGNVLINLLALMENAGIPGVDENAVAYVQQTLLPGCSNNEAAERFTKFIKESWKNWFTPVNFFFHSLGQLKFHSDAEDNPMTLSFVPRKHSIKDDGIIVFATIKGYKTEQHPPSSKHYSYVIEVKKEGLEQPLLLNRTYEEFLELYRKLCVNFSQHKKDLKKLEEGSLLAWRSNSEVIADKRKVQLQQFLGSLFLSPVEVSRSNLVNVFFYSLPRDLEKEEGDENGEGGA